jgi:uncharacterized membrane protein
VEGNFPQEEGDSSMTTSGILTPRTSQAGPPWRQNWDEPSRQWTGVNVGDAERLACALGGGALAAYGLTRGTLGGLFLAALGGGLLYRGLTGHCPMYQSLGVNTACTPHGPQASIAAGCGVRVDRSITINRSPQELWRFWRNLENLPRVMSHLERVENRGNKRSHWAAKAPMGMNVEWDAEIITERENELIGWRSPPGSEVATAGSVHFAPAPGGGTEIRVELKYDPPGGQLGHWLASAFGEDAGRQIDEDLRRFKQMCESGQVHPVTGQPAYR